MVNIGNFNVTYFKHVLFFSYFFTKIILFFVISGLKSALKFETLSLTDLI